MRAFNADSLGVAIEDMAQSGRKNERKVQKKKKGEMQMADKGMGYLKQKLSSKNSRIGLRYRYYDMKHSIEDYSRLIPEEMRWLTSSLGWCATAVDSLADRLVFREFRVDDFDMNEIYALNNKDVLFDSAVLSALISSCCFIYISTGDGGYPQMQVIDGGNATGVLNPITNLLTEGYAVLERDRNGNPILEAYFTSKSTYYYEKGKLVMEKSNPTGHPLLVPIIYRPDAKRPFGHSRISRACMKHQQSALRTIRRAEISAEFYSFPQKYILGLASDTRFDNRRATMSTFLSFGKDRDGDSPKVGQFTQQSMAPYVEQLKMFASLFAGETGLTLDDLGFAMDNPSSAEAIKASHEKLRLTARKAQRTFGTGFLNAGFLAAGLRDGRAYERNMMYETKPIWEPVFEPDAAMLSGIGDAVIKINQAVPGYFGAENLRDLTGIDRDGEGGA